MPTDFPEDCRDVEVRHPSLCIRSFHLTPQVLHEGGHAAIVRCNAGQSLGVVNGGCEIPGIAAESDECHQRVAIGRMPNQNFFQSRHCLAAAPGRMQCDGIDVGVSRSVAIELGGALKLAKRLVGPLQAGEREAQRVMQPRVLRRRGDRRTQHAFSVAIAPELPIKIGQIDRRRPIERSAMARDRDARLDWLTRTREGLCAKDDNCISAPVFPHLVMAQLPHEALQAYPTLSEQRVRRPVHEGHPRRPTGAWQRWDCGVATPAAEPT
jgi:hypothetical protein